MRRCVFAKHNSHIILTTWCHNGPKPSAECMLLCRHSWKQHVKHTEESDLTGTLHNVYTQSRCFVRTVVELQQKAMLRNFCVLTWNSWKVQLLHKSLPLVPFLPFCFSLSRPASLFTWYAEHTSLGSHVFHNPRQYLRISRPHSHGGNLTLTSMLGMFGWSCGAVFQVKGKLTNCYEYDEWQILKTWRDIWPNFSEKHHNEKLILASNHFLANISILLCPVRLAS